LDTEVAIPEEPNTIGMQTANYSRVNGSKEDLKGLKIMRSQIIQIIVSYIKWIKIATEVH
jgi:hypothetical protein